MQGEEIPDRIVIRITGRDREAFLQGLVTNDVRHLKEGAVYASLLTPQGKYLADFFLYPETGSVLLDVAAPLAQGLLKRLALYKLRADVGIEETGLHVVRGLGPAPQGAFADPRSPEMGWRATSPSPGNGPATDWDRLRVDHLVPETLIELIPDDSYILEMGLERLNGVDFRKGCYVGQEVTARMKHKTELRKGLRRVCIDGQAETGTPILCDDRTVGTLLTRAGNRALAYLRLDRIQAEMRAGTARVWLDPDR